MVILMSWDCRSVTATLLRLEGWPAMDPPRLTRRRDTAFAVLTACGPSQTFAFIFTLAGLSFRCNTVTV